VMPSQLPCCTALCHHSSAIDTVDMTPTAEPKRNASVLSSGDKLMAMRPPIDVDSPASVESSSGHATPPVGGPEAELIASPVTSITIAFDKS
jgi:hypothetical protein